MNSKQIEASFSPAFEVLGPKRPQSPLVLNSPHSGRVYPKAFQARSRLGETTLRRSEDAFVDELFLPATAGTQMLCARFPRAFLDVNREASELDPALIDGALPAGANTRTQSVSFGLGAIPRIVAEGVEIYDGKLALTEAVDRLDRLYHPYHAQLSALIEATRDRFGYAVLIDCHSMPSARSLTGASARPDFILGDLNGKSCDARLSDAAERILSAGGFAVTRNMPYAGGYITRHYGRPGAGVHTLQIEINRALYMNERSIVKHKGFEHLRDVLQDFTSALTETAWQMAQRGRMAAE